MTRNLGEALKNRFKGESVESLAEVLSLAAEKGGVRYEEIKMQEDMKIDLLLLLVKERILIPFRTSKTLAWDDRVLRYKPGEVYRMPHVIRHLIKKAGETGSWNPGYVVRRYLEEIGESDSDRILDLFNRIKEHVVENKITPEHLIEASEELDLRSKLGRIIAELKGGGIISPYLRNPSSIQYKVNPSLIE